MAIETKVIEVGDGDSVEIYTRIRHITAKSIQRIYAPYLQTPEAIALLNANVKSEQDRMSRIFELVGQSADHLGVNDVLILGQVKSWSFGEVNQQVLDDIPEEKLFIIMDEINEAYVDLPLAGSGARKSQNGYSWLSAIRLGIVRRLTWRKRA